MTHKEYSMLSNLVLDKSYKFLELTPDLLQIIEEKVEPLYIKAPTEDSDIVICTRDKTFQIRQRNHSNTVLVLTQTFDEDKDAFRGYTSMSSVFEAHLGSGKISATGIPLYDGNELINTGGDNVTTDDLRKRSAISEKEFDKVWFEMNGSSLNGLAIILSDDFITEVLQIIILSIAAAELDYDELSLIETYNSVNEESSHLSIDIVETVLRKFSSTSTEPFKMDRVKVSTWYGIHSLRKHASSKALPIDEFLIKWKSEIPPFFECPLEISLLNGYFITPLHERIQYISKENLPADILNRLKVLFKLQSTWDLEELIPFIQEFNSKGLKYENFIMKYAKKKKVGKKLLITAR